MNYERSMTKNKKILITGCSSGIGKSLLIKLLKNNFNVIAVCRNPLKINTIYKDYRNNLTIIKCDLTNIKSVKILIQKLNKIKKIDILINNAGSIFVKEKKIFSGLTKTFFLNFFIPVLLIIKLKKKFNKNKKNLIINIGSNASKTFLLNEHDLNFKENYFGYINYCKSKLYLLYLTKKLSMMFSKNIDICYVHPGLVKSNIAKNLPLIYRIGFSFANFCYGINPNTSANYIYDIIIKKIKKNGMYFDFKKKLVSNKINLKNTFLNKIWNKFKIKILHFDNI